MNKLIFYNWEYKLISLMLAAALYFYTSDLISVTNTLTITNLSQANDVIEYVPDGYQVTEIIPRTEVEVTISGPRNIVDNMQQEIELSLELDRDSIKEGEQVFAINNNLLKLDHKIKILDTRPVREIRVKVSKQKSAIIPINDKLQYIGLPESLFVSDRELDKTDLEVYGPEEIIETLDVLSVDPIDLSYLQQEKPKTAIVKNVPLKIILPKDVKTTDSVTVYAKITIRPKVAKREMNLPISVLADPEFLKAFRVQFAQPVVPVTISGPGQYLPELKSDQLTAYIIINKDDFVEEPTKALQVYVQSPSWTTVKAGRIRVTVRRRVEGEIIRDDPPIIENPVKESKDDDVKIIDPKDDGSILPKNKKKKRSILPED